MEKKYDEVIIKLSNGDYMFLQWGSEPCCPGCEACVDYTVYDNNKKEYDGGQLDFGPAEKYETIIDAIDDTVEFAYLGNDIPTYEITELDRFKDGFEI